MLLPFACQSIYKALLRKFIAVFSLQLSSALVMSILIWRGYYNFRLHVTGMISFIIWTWPTAFLTGLRSVFHYFVEWSDLLKQAGMPSSLIPLQRIIMEKIIYRSRFRSPKLCVCALSYNGGTDLKWEVQIVGGWQL